MTSSTPATTGPDTLEGSPNADLLEGLPGDDRLFGGDGDDTLQGGRDNDTLMGEGGNDWLAGAHGDDLLDGGEGDDTLNGGEGNDTLLAHGTGLKLLKGGAGADALVGEAGANVIYIGGEGDDTITERAGGTIMVGLHTGRDLINIESFGASLQFEAGIRPEDVQIQIRHDIMLISLRNGSSVVQLTSYRGKLDHITFDDGLIWDAATIITMANRGTPGHDNFQVLQPWSEAWGGAGDDTIAAYAPSHLHGDAGNDHLRAVDFNQSVLDGGDGLDWLEGSGADDVLLGGRGDDTLMGGAGRDRYVYNVGDGQDRIQEWDWSAESSDQLTVDQALVVELGPGMARHTISLWRDRQDLILQHGPAGTDQLRLVDYFVHTHLEAVFRFADGTSLMPDDVAAMVVPVPHPDHVLIPGGDGPDELSGGWGAATLVGGMGGDTLDASHSSGELIGGEGPDVYLWGLASGDVTIRSGTVAGQLYPDTDVVRLGIGIMPEMVKLRVIGLDAPTGFELLVEGHAPTLTLLSNPDSGPLDGLPRIEFADGRIWDTGNLIDTWMRQDPQAFDWMRGGNDTLNSAQDEQGAAYGGAGADTYVFGRHNDLSLIVATNTPFRGDPVYNWMPGQRWGNDTDVLRFVDGIRPQDIITAIFPSPEVGPWRDLTLRLRDSDRQIVLRDFMQNGWSDTSEVDLITFEDGTVWSRDQLMRLALHHAPMGLNLMGGVGHDRIEGEDGDDWLAGADGRDTLVGAAGRDTMEGGAGNDTYVVDSMDDVVIEFDAQGKDVVHTSIDFFAPDNVETIVLTGASDLHAIGHNNISTALIGNGGHNLLRGGSARDTLSGALGMDTLAGGDDGDYYYLIDECDTILEDANDGGLDVIFQLTENTIMAENVEILFMKTDLARNATGNEQDNFIFGNNNDCSLFGQGGADLIFGRYGEDTIAGGTGDDELHGAAGNDLYLFNIGDGQDVIQDIDIQVGNIDTLAWQGVQADQLWFTQQGSSLHVEIIGRNEGVAISKWYFGTDNQIELMTAGGKTVSANGVQALVQAMSALTPPAAGQTTLPQDYQNMLSGVIAANWL